MLNMKLWIRQFLPPPEVSWLSEMRDMMIYVVSVRGNVMNSCRFRRILLGPFAIDFVAGMCSSLRPADVRWSFCPTTTSSVLL